MAKPRYQKKRRDSKVTEGRTDVVVVGVAFAAVRFFVCVDDSKKKMMNCLIELEQLRPLLWLAIVATGNRKRIEDIFFPTAAKLWWESFEAWRLNEVWGGSAISPHGASPIAPRTAHSVSLAAPLHGWDTVTLLPLLILFFLLLLLIRFLFFPFLLFLYSWYPSQIPKSSAAVFVTLSGGKNFLGIIACFYHRQLNRSLYFLLGYRVWFTLERWRLCGVYYYYSYYN